MRQILTFSRMETHRREVMQVGPVFEESIRLLRAIVPASIEIVTRVDAPLPSILADGTAIQQVLMNLVNNASQAIGARSGRIKVTLAPREVDAAFASENPGLSAGSFLRLTVKDNGAGMPPEVAERIFEPFFTTKKPGQGTGLGLSVVHGIVQTHQGAITVKSAPGQGSTFEVFLPVARAEQEPAAEPAKPVQPVGGVDRILLVDDEAALLRASERLLVKLGYQVTACDSPAKALDLFRQNPDGFDLVLTDFSMPGQTGVELAEKLFVLRPSARILLCTGYGAGLSLEQIRNLGFCGMLQKPVNLEDLCQAIRAALDTPVKAG